VRRGHGFEEALPGLHVREAIKPPRPDYKASQQARARPQLLPKTGKHPSCVESVTPILNVSSIEVSETGVVLDPAGIDIAIEPSPPPMGPGVTNTMPAIAFDGTNYLVMWGRDPRDRPGIVRDHAPAALRAAGRLGRQRRGERFHPPLQGTQQGRTKLVLDLAFQLDEVGNLLRQHRPRSGIMIGRQVDRSARTVHGRLPFTAGAGCAAATGSRKPFLGFMSVKL
jgi:hypothetical protein